MLTLREANSELREAQADLRAYPVPEYLSTTLEQGSIMIGVTGYPGKGTKIQNRTLYIVMYIHILYIYYTYIYLFHLSQTVT